MGTCYSCTNHNKYYRKILDDDIFITEPPPSAFTMYDDSNTEDEGNDFDIIDIEDLKDSTPQNNFILNFLDSEKKLDNIEITETTKKSINRS